MPKDSAKKVNTVLAPRVGGMRALCDFPPINSGFIGQDWIAGPCTHCATSEPIEASNFDAMQDILDSTDPYGVDWGVLRFQTDFPGVKWMEIVFARPGSKAVAALGRIREELNTCSVLDPDLYVTYVERDESMGQDKDAA